MNGITNPIVFYPAAVVMILFALLSIKFNNIFYSLLSAIIVFFIAGMFFYILGSEYNAVIESNSEIKSIVDILNGAKNQ